MTFEMIPVCSWPDGFAPGWQTLESRSPEGLRGLVIHRIEVSQEDPTFGDDPGEVARFFREHPTGKKATGGAMPYPILIDGLGAVTQALPLGRIAPHAVSHNPTTVGIGCVGDFRATEPGPEQYTALVLVCGALVYDFGLPVEAIWGHDELGGGSREPDKICPGAGLSMERLRSDVRVLKMGGDRHRFVW